MGPCWRVRWTTKRPWFADMPPGRWAEAPGNTLLTSRVTGLPKDSIANASQLVTLDRTVLTERVGKLPKAKVDLILAGIDVILGR